MASTEGPARPHDRHARRRPFANWMKRLANLKNLHNENTTSRQNTKKPGVVKNHPYPMQVRTTQQDYSNSQMSPSLLSTPTSRHSSTSREKVSFTLSHDGQGPPKSRAPTMGTTAETTISDTAKSGVGTTGTTATAARTEGDRDSTFSSPSPSLRSVTTTLTTMQSTTPVLGQPGAGGPLPNNAVYSTAQPASAVPAHLVPHSHPATYHIATANNVLTDDASIITLASSSKRRRRNSLDTNASIRALAPASMFGGSRESLPLSILSSSAAHYTSRDPTSARDREGDGASFRDTASSHYPRSISAMNAERASLISASGVTAPALTSERNSYISNKPTGDGASVRSGMLGHGLDNNNKERDRSLYHARNDSIGGLSITRERYKDTPGMAGREGSFSGTPSGVGGGAGGGSGMGGIAGQAQAQESYFKEREMVTAPTSPMPAS